MKADLFAKFIANRKKNTLPVSGGLSKEVMKRSVPADIYLPGLRLVKRIYV